MTTIPGTAPTTTASPTGEAVVWAFDPWRERPRVAVLSALGAVGMCALVVASRLPFLMGVALAVLCVASLSPALTPVECRADAGGAARRGLLGWQRRRWEDVRRVEPLPAGVLLSAHARRHWLDSTRALVLPMPAARRDEIRAALDALRGAHGR
jgi:hypothetical protein